MARAFVHAAQQAFEPLAEGVIAFRAAHAADFLQLGRGEAAGRARQIRRGVHGTRCRADKRLRQPEARHLGHALGLRAGLAQVHRGHLTVDDLGEEDGGLCITNVAFHGFADR